MKRKFKIQTGDLIVTDEEKKVINEILDSGQLSEGKYVQKFERNWAKYIGTKHCCLLNSGTSALMVGFKALEQVQNLRFSITTPFTYVATVNSTAIFGHYPNFVDINPETMGMDAESLKIFFEQQDWYWENNTMVLPVHIMGIPCEIDKIQRLCKKFKVTLFEDNCQAYGTKYKGKMLGSYGDLSACSFYIAHTLQCSEMGSLNTNSRYLRRLFDKIKSNGRTSSFDKHKEKYYKTKFEDSDDFHPRYYHDVIGGNFRTTEFSAALAYVQLKEIDTIIKKRNDNVKYLNEQLEPYSDIIKLPMYHKDFAYLGYPLVINKPNIISRKKMRLEIENRGIETRPLYGCLPNDMPSLKKHYELKQELPNAEHIGRNAFYFGCHQYLTQEDLDYIVTSIKQILRHKK